jgi:hypothetical protein
MIRLVFRCRCARIVCSLALHRLRPILPSKATPTRPAPLSFAKVASQFVPLRPLPGGRRLAAARTGVSDCAGFTPN